MHDVQFPINFDDSIFTNEGGLSMTTEAKTLPRTRAHLVGLFHLPRQACVQYAGCVHIILSGMYTYMCTIHGMWIYVYNMWDYSTFQGKHVHWALLNSCVQYFWLTLHEYLLLVLVQITQFPEINFHGKKSGNISAWFWPSDQSTFHNQGIPNLELRIEWSKSVLATGI